MSRPSALERVMAWNTGNYQRVIDHFHALGYEDVRPKENVFTIAAWRELGRQIMPAHIELGVPVRSVVKTTFEDGEVASRGVDAMLYHYLQTELLPGEELLDMGLSYLYELERD